VAYETTKNLLIGRRLALFMCAGVLVGTLVSAATPIGPQEARLRARLRELRTCGLRDIRISWAPSAAMLSREERTAAVLALIDAPAQTITSGDRSRVAA
jgi:hypothetical protein